MERASDMCRKPERVDVQALLLSTWRLRTQTHEYIIIFTGRALSG